MPSSSTRAGRYAALISAIIFRMLRNDVCSSAMFRFRVMPTDSLSAIVKTPPYAWVLRQQVVTMPFESITGLATSNPFLQLQSRGLTRTQSPSGRFSKLMTVAPCFRQST